MESNRTDENAQPDSRVEPRRAFGALIFALAALVANPWLVGLTLTKNRLIAQPGIVGAIVGLEVLLLLAAVLIAVGQRSWRVVFLGIVGLGLGIAGVAEFHLYQGDIERIVARRVAQQRMSPRQAILQRAIELNRGPIAEFGTESSEVLPGLHERVHTLQVEVPAGGVLDTAIAIDPLVTRFFRGTITFAIDVRDSSGGGPLFSKSWNMQSPGEPSPFQWVPLHVDLSRYAGRKIELSLRRSYGGDDAWRARNVYDLEPTDLAVWRTPVVRPRHLEGRKNLILISIDTLRADHLHFMGYGRETSPNLDRLAAQGIVFDQCISQAPWTVPSHFSILTGTYPSTNGANSALNLYEAQNVLTLDKSPRHWNPRIPALAMILRDRGYETAAFTGMGTISASFGFYRGFDSYNETARVGFGGKAARDGDSRGDDINEITDKTIRWIARNRDRTFFLFVHTFEVHWPFTHDDFVQKERIDPKDATATNIALYDGDILYTDRQLGRLIDAFREHGLMDDTLVVFVSDHGEDLGENAAHDYGLHVGHGHNLFDELLHIPLVFHGLSSQTRPARIRPQVRAIDILPTVLDDLGVPKPDTIEGASLLPMIRGEETADRPAYSEATTYGPDRESLRADGFKYIHRLGYGELGAPCCTDFPLTPLNELYDLRADPRELHNVAGERPDALARMEALMNAIRPRLRLTSEKPEPSPSVPVSPEVIQSLRSLGYIH